MVVIHECGAHAPLLPRDSHFCRYIREFSAVVMKQANAVGLANRQIRRAIVIKIARGAAQPGTNSAQSRLAGHIFELPTAHILQHPALSFSRGHQKQIRLAIPIVVKHANAGARALHIRQRCGRVMYRDLRRRIAFRTMHKFSQRKFSLVSISGAKWCT